MNEFQRTAPPTATPWGRPSDLEEIAPGWWSVGTSTHGGFVLSPERTSCIPKAHLEAAFNNQGKAGFFEEDCDWVIPVLAFPAEFSDYLKRKGRADDIETVLERAELILNRWIFKNDEVAA